jgi:hypothetical protein
MVRKRIDLDIVLLGRLLGVAIIIAGIVSTALDASANGGIGGPGRHAQLREFLLSVPFLVWFGGILIAGAEITDRVMIRDRAGRIDWNVIGLVNVLGVAIIAVGLSATVWNLRVEHSSFSRSLRYFLRLAIQYVFEGGLLFVLAGLATHIGADTPEEPDEGEGEAEPVVAQPPAPQASETSAALP